jgi:Spy/CpxP family protein refolding chaperone
MKHTLNTIKIIALSAGFVWAGSLFAQNSGHHSHHSHGNHDKTASGQQTTPYAGMQSRSIKALSPQEVQDWLDGKGMTQALPAELNGYPGPMHVLEWQDQLKLTAQQRQATQALMAQHKEQVRQLGAELIAAEKTLDQAFANKKVDAGTVERYTAAIGQLQAKIRASHLVTHLEQTRLLQAEQIAAYQKLRGYAN